MSYSEVFIIKEEIMESVAELRNAWGFGPFVWDAFSKKYLGEEHKWLLMFQLPKEYNCEKFKSSSDDEKRPY